MRYNLWQGDLAEPLQMQLGTRDPLTNVTVNFVMAQIGGPTRIEQPAVIDDEVARLVHYDWQTGDTDVAGIYRAVMKVLRPGSLPETYPSDEPVFIVIRAKL